MLAAVMGGALPVGAAPPDVHASDRMDPPATTAPRHILVYSRTAGYRHDSIPDGIRALRSLGSAHGFEVDATEDPSWFTDDVLARYAVIVFLSTTGTVLDEAGRRAMEARIDSGGGFVGIHAAADTEYDWPWFRDVIGAHFSCHPAIQPAVIDVVDGAHPSTRDLPRRWHRTDEWYNYGRSPRGIAHVLLMLDESSYAGGTMQQDHPIAWCRRVGHGRAWYTGGGHTSESFREPAFLRHLLGGIAWAAGWADDDGLHTAAGAYTAERLRALPDDVVALAALPDGSIIIAAATGRLWWTDASAADMQAIDGLDRDDPDDPEHDGPITALEILGAPPDGSRRMIHIIRGVAAPDTPAIVTTVTLERGPRGLRAGPRSPRATRPATATATPGSAPRTSWVRLGNDGPYPRLCRVRCPQDAQAAVPRPLLPMQDGTGRASSPLLAALPGGGLALLHGAERPGAPEAGTARDRAPGAGVRSSDVIVQPIAWDVVRDAVVAAARAPDGAFLLVTRDGDGRHGLVRINRRPIDAAPTAPPQPPQPWPAARRGLVLDVVERADR